MNLELASRVYVLTGASRGLGYATAECLVAEGARVVISSRDPQHVADAATRLGGAEHALGVTADLGDPEAPQRLVRAALDQFGRIDGALLSVGGPPPGTALSATDEQWLASFQTIFIGAVRAARVIAGEFTEGGAIAFVLSSSVRAPIPNLGISNGLRPGLAGVAKDMADELAPRGVRVISLLPGRVLTARNEELFAATGDPAAARAAAEGAIPMRRLGDPAEFGRVAAFLLSPAASYLTGIAVPIDGGAARGI